MKEKPGCVGEINCTFAYIADVCFLYFSTTQCNKVGNTVLQYHGVDVTSTQLFLTICL